MKHRTNRTGYDYRRTRFFDPYSDFFNFIPSWSCEDNFGIHKRWNISKKIRFNITTNLFWAFIYNIIFIPIAAGCFSMFGVVLEPMYCSMLMALSSVTVCLNALTLFLTTKRNNK